MLNPTQPKKYSEIFLVLKHVMCTDYKYFLCVKPQKRLKRCDLLLI